DPRRLDRGEATAHRAVVLLSGAHRGPVWPSQRAVAAPPGIRCDARETPPAAVGQALFGGGSSDVAPDPDSGDATSPILRHVQELKARRRGRAAPHPPAPLPKHSAAMAQSPCRTLPLGTSSGRAG